MSGTWPRVKLGEVLVQDQRYINVPESREYPKLSVKLYGKGVVLDAPADGSALKMRRHQIARAGQVILSEIWGKKGAIGFVPEEGNGALCTSHFFLFDVVHEKVDSGWLQALFTANYLEPQLSADAKGTTGYAAVRPKTLLNCEIPLPPLAEQRRIVDELQTLSAEIGRAISLSEQAQLESSTLFEALATRAFPRGPTSSVGQHVRFQTGYAFKSEWFSDEGIRLARNANVGHGRLDWTETVRLPAERFSEFRKFELVEGDILLALDRPLISSGTKVARVQSSDLPCLLLQRVARAQFTGAEVLHDYFYCWLQSPLFARAIDPGRSNGVPHISHKDVEELPIPVPSLAEQRRVVAAIASISGSQRVVAQHKSEATAALGALVSSALGRAFGGVHQ